MNFYALKAFEILQSKT